MSSATSKKARLGRGLSSLLAPAAPATAEQSPSTPWRLLSIDRIQTARQPRTHFDDKSLIELADSIRESGLLQPLVVRPEGEGTFTLIAGERRFRASRIAGLDNVPVVIRDVDQRDAYVLALLENIQRQDLGALEEAEAFRYLIEDQNLTQEEVARRVGRSRTAVANTLRLLKLPKTVRALVENDKISAGHARALLGLPDDATRNDLAERIANDGLSVRQVEDEVRIFREDEERARQKANGTPQAKEKGTTPSTAQVRAQVRAVERQLRDRLSAKVNIRQKLDGAGTIEIHFADDEGLQDILDRILP